VGTGGFNASCRGFPTAPWHLVAQLRRNATGAAPPPATPATGSRLKRGVVLCLKTLVLWVPALFFWVSVAYGAPLLDLRTEDEIQEDENEVRRLERFFDVEGLPEAEYMAEWTVKEEALSNIVEKLLKSHRFMEMLSRGPDEYTGSEPLDTQQPAPWSQSHKVVSPSAEAEAVEVSYVLPPPGAAEDAGLAEVVGGSSGPRPWAPRLVVAHRGGSLALVSLTFEYVVKGKDREERWACTALRGDLVAAPRGVAAFEQICDLRGPVPHGVRYMRI